MELDAGATRSQWVVELVDQKLSWHTPYQIVSKSVPQIQSRIEDDESKM